MCDIRYLTWMHTNRTLTVAPEFDVINLDAQLPNGEWDITMVTVCTSFSTIPSVYMRLDVLAGLFLPLESSN